MFRHPNYYKELRKRNRDLSELQRVKPERSVPQSDQAISYDDSTESQGVRPGPGLKQQAIDETVPHNDIEEASSAKQQASSESKPEPVQVQEASSAKRQASQSE